MSNPTIGKMEEIRPGTPFHNIPLCYVSPEQVDAWRGRALALKDIEALKKAFKDLDATVARTVFHGADSFDPQAQEKIAKGKDAYVVARLGAPELGGRTRTRANAYKALAAGFPAGVLERHRANMLGQLKAGGGVNNGFGRLRAAYPKRGADWSHIVPPTDEESATAVTRCGWNMDSVAARDRVLLPYEKDPMSDGQAMRINMNSTIGSPFFVVPNKVPGALPVVMEWVHSFDATMREVYAEDKEFGVSDWVSQNLMGSGAKFFTNFMRCKNDYYQAPKIDAEMMRLYNVAAALPSFVVRRLIQSCELHSKNYLNMKSSRTAQRTGMARANTVKLINHVAGQVAASLKRSGGKVGFGYSHSGDDSILVIFANNKWYTASTDYSNYDLTQLDQVKTPIVTALADQLRKFDAPGAQLFQCLHRNPAVVVGGPVTLRMKHGGLSGLPGQSEINDGINDVAYQRMEQKFLAAEPEEICEEFIRHVVESETHKLGLVARLDDYSESEAPSLEMHLEEHPLLYLGYFITSTMVGSGENKTREIAPIMNPDRMLPRLLFKSHSAPAQDPTEVLALAGLSLGLGSVSFSNKSWLRDYISAYRRFDKHVLGLLANMHKDNVPFPSHLVETAIGGMVYYGVDDTPTGWESLRAAIFNKHSTWNRAAPPSLAYRLSLQDNNEESPLIAIPLLEPMAPLPVSDAWADDLPEFYDMPQEEGKLEVARGKPRKKLDAKKFQIHKGARAQPAQNIMGKHTGKKPPTVPPPPPKVAKPVLTPAQVADKKYGSARFRDEEEFEEYEDSSDEEPKGLWSGSEGEDDFYDRPAPLSPNALREQMEFEMDNYRDEGDDEAGDTVLYRPGLF